ncbi:collagen alpha-1(II) chain-like [Porites lutea]|uniref:collagen alpha-1(II) chain-like n=1 Tax=Porites lutea TaxID=51062 RepID=UPI003CC64320
MSSSVENYKFPVGTKDNPAMTCKELMDIDNIQNGYFWIDPNLGCPADAIRVYCNFTAGGETCVPPSRDTIPKRTWQSSPEASSNRFSRLEEGFKINYTASRIQFNFLRLLSTRVRQSVRVKCKRVVVWFHRVSRSYRYSWIFHGRKGFDFTPNSNPKPKVMRDYCQRDDGKWRRAEITFDSERVDVLPLEDLSFFHRAVGKEQFGVKIGPVCYR